MCVTGLQVHSKDDNGWCVKQHIETKAPQGDAFFIVTQWVGSAVSANKSHLIVTMHVSIYDMTFACV